MLSGKCVIDTPKQFAKHADKAIKRITSLYLPAEDVLIEPGDMESSPRIKYILQFHMIKRFFDEQTVPYLSFFKMATYEKAFFTEFYEEGACGHRKIAADDNHCGSCLGDYEPNEEWLQSPICEVWFHSSFLFDNGQWN